MSSVTTDDRSTAPAASTAPTSTAATPALIGGVDIGGGMLIHRSVADAIEPTAARVEWVAPEGFDLPLHETGITFEVDVTNQPDGPVQIWIPAPDLGDDEIPLVAATDAFGQPWALLYTERSPDGDYLIATTHHFSLFSVVTSFVSDVVSLADDLLDVFTSNVFAEAEQPTCANEDEARNGHEIGWDGDDTIKWCVGVEDGQLIARVANARRYALLASLQQMSHAEGGGPLLDRIAQSMAFGGVALAPREQVKLTLAPQSDSPAILRTEFDGVADSLYQLQYGIELAVFFLANGRVSTTKSIAELTEAFLSVDKCRAVLDLPELGAADLLRGCFTPDILADNFGIAGAFGAVFMLSGALVDFFRSRANAFGDILNGRDEYRLVVTLSESAADMPAECTAYTFEPEVAAACLLLGWQAGDDELVARFAEPGGIGDLDALGEPGNWGLAGCSDDRSTSATWLGMYCTYTSFAGAGAVDLLFAAYDDGIFVDALVPIDGGGSAEEPAGSILYQHPQLGGVTITIDQESESEYATWPTVRAVVDATGETVFEWASTERYESFGFADTFSGNFDATVDDRGHVFFGWNPGRFDGISYLTPTANGFDARGTLTDDFYGGHYYAYTVDPDGDGRFEIEQHFQVCEPSCAGGIYYSRIWPWDGNGYSGPTEPAGGDGPAPSGADAEAAFLDYLRTAGAREYGSAWQLLSTGYQIRYDGFDDFEAFWQRVGSVGVNSVLSSRSDQGTTTLEIDLWFDLFESGRQGEVVEVDFETFGEEVLISDYRFIRQT